MGTEVEQLRLVAEDAQSRAPARDGAGVLVPEPGGVHGAAEEGTAVETPVQVDLHGELLGAAGAAQHGDLAAAGERAGVAAGDAGDDACGEAAGGGHIAEQTQHTQRDGDMVGVDEDVDVADRAAGGVGIERKGQGGALEDDRRGRRRPRGRR